MQFNVLSVDWDYFFPCTYAFDWGSRETLFNIETFWTVRAYNKMLFDEQGRMMRREKAPYAIDAFRPREDWRSFWETYCRISPSKLVVAESHYTIAEVLNLLAQQMKGASFRVVNFDAHHDAGYQKGKPVVDCDNWAQKVASITDYTLVYPAYREGYNPQPDPIREPDRTLYGPPDPSDLPSIYLLCFVCRSGAWTPPWSDDKWIEFIEYWKTIGNLWSEKGYVEYALKARPWDQQEADFMRAELERHMQRRVKK